MGFEQYGGYAKLGYDFTENWRVRADVNVTHFNASNPGAVSAPLVDADQSVTRGMTSLAVENEYERTSGALSVFYNWGDHHINDGYQPSDGETPLDYRFNSHDDMMGISAYQSVRLFRGNRLTAGVDWYRFGGSAWNQYVAGERNGEREDIVDIAQHEVAGYVDFRQNIGTWLTFNAGLRVDHHSRLGTEWVPQAGLAFHLPYALELKVSAGKGFRYPTIREMYMFPPQNPDLRPERLWSYEVALSQKLLDGRVSYGLNVFYIDGDNTIQTLPNPSGGGPLNQNTGEIHNAGVEVQAAWRIARDWSVDANYSFLHMENPVVAAPEHKLYVGGLFTHGRWHVSTGVTPRCRRISSSGTSAPPSASWTGCPYGCAARTCLTSATRSMPASPCPAPMSSAASISNFSSDCPCPRFPSGRPVFLFFAITQTGLQIILQACLCFKLTWGLC